MVGSIALVAKLILTVLRVEDVQRSAIDPKKAFIISALDKEIRLSFAKRIRETLPVVYHSLIPEGKDNDTPEFKYIKEGKFIRCRVE